MQGNPVWGSAFIVEAPGVQLAGHTSPCLSTASDGPSCWLFLHVPKYAKKTVNSEELSDQAEMPFWGEIGESIDFLSMINGSQSPLSQRFLGKPVNHHGKSVRLFFTPPNPPTTFLQSLTMEGAPDLRVPLFLFPRHASNCNEFRPFENNAHPPSE